ncbi:MAG: uroporphyrinogen-III C-methyltransferase, partial [Lapillicoccus sp.]
MSPKPDQPLDLPSGRPDQAQRVYPLALDLTDRRVLVVGGGAVAARRARGLLDAGARVDVVAPEVGPEMTALVSAGSLRWSPVGFDPTDLVVPEPAWLVHTATGVPDVDAEVARAAEAERVWCVRADSASASSAWTPAVSRGAAGGPAEGLTVAVSGGGDPRRAVAVRDAIAAGLESGRLPVRRVRSGCASSAVATDASPVDALPVDTQRVGRVWLVGGGPGDPDLITVRGRMVLAAADVVVADRLGPRSLLDDLGPDVEVIDVGKTPGHHPISQDRINEILVEHALAGRDVVRLKGGDPFVLGRGGEEALHCVANGVPVEVVPGVTSAISVPAAAGIPVTQRGITASFVVASAHEGAASALDALRDAPVSSTLVLLMGITTLRETAEQLMASGRSPGTPVALIESGWTDDQRTTVTTLEKAADVAEQEAVRAPAVIIIGEVVAVRAQLGDLRGSCVDLRGNGGDLRGRWGSRAGATPSPDTRDLVLLAHGSPDPRHAEGVAAVVERVGRLAPARAIHPAYLDHHPPSATDVAGRLSGGVLVPLLLTRATHVRGDVPVAAAEMTALGRGGYAVAGALGPDDLLFDACEELLVAGEFARDERTAVVLFAGGSSDREAIAAIGAAAAVRGGTGWGPWAVAALAGGDTLAEVVARLQAAPDVDRVLVLS